jgi:hypothetical protein
MNRRVRTARGKMIDMAAISAKYETTKAVGNVLMNAKGDRLNPDGSIRVSAETIARTHHNIKTPPQETAISDPKPLTPTVTKPTQPIVTPEYESPQPVSRITKTRDDGSRYVEIEYDDGSMETQELNEE